MGARVVWSYVDRVLGQLSLIWESSRGKYPWSGFFSRGLSSLSRGGGGVATQNGKNAIQKLDDSEFRNALSHGYIRVKEYDSSHSRIRSRDRSKSRSYSRSRSRSISPQKQKLKLQDLSHLVLDLNQGMPLFSFIWTRILEFLVVFLNKHIGKKKIDGNGFAMVKMECEYTCSNSGVQEVARVVMEKKGVTDIIVNEILKSSIAIVPIEFRLPSLANRSVFAVNNAGTINKNNRLWEVLEEEFNAVIDTNLKEIANMLRHFIPLMIEKKQGILVAPYCASKWVVERLTKSVAKELLAGMEIVALNLGIISNDSLWEWKSVCEDLPYVPDELILQENGCLYRISSTHLASNGRSGVGVKGDNSWESWWDEEQTHI
uniref:3-oxoacyl-[acyl-carrier-protein] reductase n=1 Tax=Lactuca sativa TaxID=4236 RepID=A0A9R1V994_LACSA|nr:hypothetical protein LSAT_V11C600326780 [Lactuca sativa]